MHEIALPDFKDLGNKWNLPTFQTANHAKSSPHLSSSPKTDIVTRRVFIFLFQRVRHDTPRNTVWREFVPLVKDSSEKLNRLQAYMVIHQNEATLVTLDRLFLSDIDACIADLQGMIKKLQALRDICRNSG